MTPANEHYETAEDALKKAEHAHREALASLESSSAREQEAWKRLVDCRRAARRLAMQIVKSL